MVVAVGPALAAAVDFAVAGAAVVVGVVDFVAGLLRRIHYRSLSLHLIRRCYLGDVDVKGRRWPLLCAVSYSVGSVGGWRLCFSWPQVGS